MKKNLVFSLFFALFLSGCFAEALQDVKDSVNKTKEDISKVSNTN